MKSERLSGSTTSSLFFVVVAFLSAIACKSGTNSGSTIDASTDNELDASTDTGDPMIDPEVDWIEVVPGSFTYGSPDSTPCRGAYVEKEIPVSLTRAFLMARTETTQKQWHALGVPVPEDLPPCDDCPVTVINFWEAAAWCNRLSEFEGLEPCYDLSSCSGEVGSGCPGDDWSCAYEYGPDVPDGAQIPVEGMYYCNDPIRRYQSMYDCPGYRLPTTAEWEYAAKAGTTTNTYNGDITNDSDGVCVDEPILNDIAWYCCNSGVSGDGSTWTLDHLREVGLKQPNAWGFVDLLGNAWEWTDNVLSGWGLDFAYGSTGGPLVDPVGVEENFEGDITKPRELRGGAFHGIGCRVRVSYQFYDNPIWREAASGFRPVRTLPAEAKKSVR